MQAIVYVGLSAHPAVPDMLLFWSTVRYDGRKEPKVQK